MRAAYADPPYLGCCSLYQHDHGTDGRCWDEPSTHGLLMERLRDEFPDGWAMSLSAPSLAAILSLHRWPELRVGAWVKPFASFKPNVNPAFCWEPVIWMGGRKRTRDELTVRDYYSGGITLKRGFTGAKPEGFCFWIFGLLGLERGDEFVDVFPGSGAVSAAWERYQRQARLIV